MNKTEETTKELNQITVDGESVGEYLDKAKGKEVRRHHAQEVAQLGRLKRMANKRIITKMPSAQEKPGPVKQWSKIEIWRKNAMNTTTEPKTAKEAIIGILQTGQPSTTGGIKAELSKIPKFSHVTEASISAHLSMLRRSELGDRFLVATKLPDGRGGGVLTRMVPEGARLTRSQLVDFSKGSRRPIRAAGTRKKATPTLLSDVLRRVVETELKAQFGPDVVVDSVVAKFHVEMEG